MRILILLFLAVLLPWTSPVQAQQAAPADPKPHLLIVIADHLTFSDFHRPDCPNLLAATEYGQSALMSPGLAHGADPVSDVYATFGAGDSIRKGEILQGLLADTLRGAHISFTTIGDADGDDTGIFRPVDLFLPGAPHLTGGFMRDPLAPGGLRCDAPVLAKLSISALLVNDLVVVHDGDFARLERENREGVLTPAAYAAHRRRALMRLDDFAGEVQEPSPSILNNFPVHVFFLVPCGPLDASGQWDRLTPFIRLPGRGRIHLLTSDTTQTTGVVAARDIAPTILAEFSVLSPVTMTGAPIDDSADWTILSRLDRLTYLNQKIQLPFFWGLGFLGGGLVFFAVWFYVSTRTHPRPAAQRVLQFGVRMLAAWPLALLISPLLPVQTPTQYLVAIFGVTALVALLPSPGVIAMATAGVLMLDAVFGTALVSQSALSAYYLSGIRFYGIGNEYMGVLLGSALIAATVLPKPNGKRWPWGLAWFGLVTFVLSFPEFGAKAGGAITAVLTFKVMWQKMRGRPLGAKHLLVGLAIGVGIVLFWGVAGHFLGLRRTHIDTAVGALEDYRFGYIMGVVRRKAELALRVGLYPGTLLGVAGLGILVALGRSLLKRPLGRFLETRPAYRAVLEAGAAGCIVCALFNDSGVVAAILLFITIVLPVLHDLLGEERCDLSPSISAKSV